MVGVLSGYYLFAYFSNEPKSGHWFDAYYVVGGLSLFAFLVLLSAKLDESPIKKEKVNSSREDLVSMLSLIVMPLVVSFVICAFFYVLIEQSTMNWLPTFNKAVLQIQEQLAIILAIFFPVPSLLAASLFLELSWFAVLMGCLVGATIVLSISLYLANHTEINQPIDSFSQIPIVAFIFPTIGIFLAPIYPALNSVVLSSLPKARHAGMSGLIVIFSAIGGTLGSIITGYLFDEVGGIKAFYFSFIPILILAIFIYTFKRSRYKNNKAGAIKVDANIAH